MRYQIYCQYLPCCEIFGSTNTPFQCLIFPPLSFQWTITLASWNSTLLSYSSSNTSVSNHTSFSSKCLLLLLSKRTMLLLALIRVFFFSHHIPYTQNNWGFFNLAVWQIIFNPPNLNHHFRSIAITFTNSYSLSPN